MKQKIAILGGGWGAISTALLLTDPANPRRDDYEITIYQLGWRLGGKGASGRGPDGRIEEHGLHVWMGFYDNSFRAIQRVYDEVQPIFRRDYPDSPFTSWRDAFKPHSYIVLAENIDAQWKTWGIDFPTNDETPGVGPSGPLSPWDYLQMLLQFLWNHHRSTAAVHHSDGTILQAAVDLLERSEPDNPEHHGLLRDRMIGFLDGLRRDFHPLDSISDDLRRITLVLELGAVTIKGLIEDGILTHPDGLDALDRYDLREWLRRHGASRSAVDSAPVRGLYDLVFGYQNGEIGRPNFAAGAAIRSMLRIGLTYKGAIFWKMQAGMGDTVFAPPYLVLKERGVRFEFFHRVTNLQVDPDGQSIDAVDIDLQATLKPEYADYDPLVVVGGLPCWPAAPRYEQLIEGEALRAGGINPESFYTPWRNPARRVLRRGEDFDRVILGISIAAFPYLCRELIEHNPRFADMVNNVATVRTQAFQLWLTKDLGELGWKQPSPVLDAYADPLNTWADMSQLIDREDWPAGLVGNIAYFCGPMVGGLAPPERTDEPLLALTRTRQAALDYVQGAAGFLWPDAAPEGNPRGLDFTLLAAPDATTPMDHFDAQFFRANIDPSERYVLSLKGTTEYRLGADESGFDNLILTGDWTRNGFNAGCIEATTMAGMRAANALCGYPKLEEISGLEPG